MGRRRVRGSSRKKPPTSKDKQIEKFITSLKEFAMTSFILLLLVANLIIIVSMIFQIILDSIGGEKSSQNKIGQQKVKSSKNVIKVEQQEVRSSKNLIKVEILNGCGVDRLAARLREYLIDEEYDVVDFRNYERYDIEKTFVIDRKYMDKRNAEKVAAIIGVKKRQAFPQLSPQRKLDVSIIIGKDYQDLKAFK